MKVRLVVEVEVDHVAGKFAGKDEVVEFLDDEIRGVLDGIPVDGIGADGDSEYEVVSVEIEPAG